jgi:hypothetical protein
LQLAAERGRTIGVLFRGANAMRKASLAMLRLLVEPSSCGIRVRVLKGRGGRRDWISLSWNEAHALESS